MCGEDKFKREIQGIWLWDCPNCHEAFEARWGVDLDSARRRQEFEKKLGFEVDVRLWDELCDGCQQSFLWFAANNKNKCARYWKKAEEVKRVHDKTKKELAGRRVEELAT